MGHAFKEADGFFLGLWMIILANMKQSACKFVSSFIDWFCYEDLKRLKASFHAPKFPLFRLNDTATLS